MLAVNIYTKFNGSHYKTISDPTSYSHTINTSSGFESASFSISVPERELQDWASSALSNHIEVVDESGRIVWEGMIDSVNISYGGGTVTVGPLVEIANKVKVAYQTVDYSIVWLPSVSRETTFASDTQSQDRYFIFEEVLSVQDSNETIAEAVRDSYLNFNKGPAIAHTIDVGQGQINVQVDCVGYRRMLEAYFYSDNTVGGIDADAKIKNVLAADPNGIFSSVSTSNIDSNTLQVPQFSEGNERGGAVIQGIVNFGDTSGNRWLFTVYENRIPYYEQVGTSYDDISYYYDASAGIVTDTNGVEVKPWHIRPGTWAITTSIFPEKPGIKQTVQDDDRAFFIESVNFSIPYNLSVSGGRFDTVNQRIARLGILGLQ